MRKNSLLIVGVVVATLAVAAGGYFFVYPMLRPAEARSAEPASATKESTQGSGMIYTLKERVLNLADRGTRRYLKLEVAMELRGPDGWDRLSSEERQKKQSEFTREMDQRAPLFNDALTTLVTTRTTEQLSDLAGKEALKEELRAKFETVLEGHKVTHVYFTEFLMQ